MTTVAPARTSTGLPSMTEMVRDALHLHDAGCCTHEQPCSLRDRLDGVEGGYHDYRCTCDGHCRNCFDDLATVREVRDQLIAEGKDSPDNRLGPRERYCSPYCRNRAKRERALDRALSQEAGK